MKVKDFNVNIVNIKQQERDLSRHTYNLYIHEGKTFQCPYCVHKSTQKSNLKTHIQSIHEGIKFQCQYCGYKATQKYSLKIHIQSKHEGKTFQ